MADAMTVLGISKAPSSIKELAKLQKRSKQLCKYYLKMARPQDSKKVEWAYAELKKGVPMPDKKPAAGAARPGATDGSGGGVEGGGRKRRNGHEAGEDAPSPPPAKRRRANAADRREAIKEKLAARRAERENSVGDKERRQEAIKERLAAKRVMKQVKTRAQEECKKTVVDFLSSSNGADDHDSAPGRIVLLCPVSIERIKLPARGHSCKHLQCFDLEAFLMSKSRTCPVCEAELAAPTSDLFVDSHFRKMLRAVGEEANEVTFNADGSWQVYAGEDEDAAESDWSNISIGDDEDEDEDDDGGEAETAAAAKAAEEEAAEAAEAAEKAEGEARAAAAAAMAKLRAEKLAKLVKEVAAAKVEAKRVSEERKWKAVLPFIPKGRAGAAGARAQAGGGYAADDAPAGVDPTDESSYLVVALKKPVGLGFEANPGATGGVCIASLAEGGAAAAHGALRRGDQLVGVGDLCLLGRDVASCTEAIKAELSARPKLTVFRGAPAALYGDGADREWIVALLERVHDGSLRPMAPLVANGSEGGASPSAGEGSPTATVAAASPSAEDSIGGDGDLLRLGPAKFVQGVARLVLKNVAAGCTAYRVRTNAPTLVSMKPTGGTLRPGEKVALKITSSDKKIGRRGVKFVVHAVPAPSSDELPKERWAEIDKADIAEWVVVGKE